MKCEIFPTKYWIKHAPRFASSPSKREIQKSSNSSPIPNFSIPNFFLIAHSFDLQTHARTFHSHEQGTLSRISSVIYYPCFFLRVRINRSV